MHIHACTFQKLHACVATASRGHANHTCDTRATRVLHVCDTHATRVLHVCDTRGPFKLWVICTVC